MKKNLTQYTANKNMWRKLTGQPLYDVFNLSAVDVAELAQSLDCDLSPENLYCDGEISATQARTKYNFLVKVIKELRTVGHPFTLYEV
jgi:hypothetical protein